jgi:hypothetical protein
MPYATGSGVRIHYEVEGSGPPLVMVGENAQAHSGTMTRRRPLELQLAKIAAWSRANSAKLRGGRPVSSRTVSVVCAAAPCRISPKSMTSCPAIHSGMPA